MTQLVPLVALLVPLAAPVLPFQESASAKVYLPDEPPVIPFEIVQGSPVVECELAGRGPIRLLVDTGASGVVLDERLAEELGLEVLGETAIGDPSDPTALKAKRVRVGELRLADAAFEQVAAVAWPQPAGLLPPGVRGILGLALFEPLTFTLDYPRGELRLGEKPLGEPDGARILVLTRDAEGGLVSVPITVGDERLQAVIDTGNDASLVLPAELEPRLALVAGTRKEGRAMRASGPVGFVTGRLQSSLCIGSTVLAEPSVRFTAGAARANLGHDVLRRFAVTIDLRNQRIRFEPGAPADASAPR